MVRSQAARGRRRPVARGSTPRKEVAGTPHGRGRAGQSGGRRSKDREVIASLRTLHDLTKAVNSSLERDEVENMVLENTARLIGSARVVLLLIDKDKGGLRLHRAHGFEVEDPGALWLRHVSPFEQCIVQRGRVIRLKEILSTKDYACLVRKMPFFERMVFAPLEVRGEATGLMGVISKGGTFSEIQREIFCALASQSAVAMENAELYGRIKSAFLGTAEALAEAVNRRDPYTGGHARRVARYSLLLAGKVGLAPGKKEELRLAAILHDIGKIGIEDSILRKGGLLTEEEALLMRKHPRIGARILALADGMKGVIPGVLYHHEWYDGSGYPEGLSGEKIPLMARIIAIGDAYDAMTTERPYRKALGTEYAFEELYASGGTHLDPTLVEAFDKVMREETKR